MKIPICFSIDNNFAEQLCVTMLSIIKNKSAEDILDFYIIDKDISKENKNYIENLAKKYNCRIKFLGFNPEKIKNCPHVNEHVSIVSYCRLLLPDLIPEEDKLLYLDCDIIVRGSLNELISTNIGNSYAALARDVNEEEHKKRLCLKKYCNSGVILFNAKEWRQNRVAEKALKWVEQNKSTMIFQDQDAINGSINDHIMYLDDKWNIQTSNRICSINANRISNKGIILHYIGIDKPWHCKNCGPLTLEYYKYYKEICNKNFLKKKFKTILALAPEKILSLKRYDNNSKTLTILGIRILIRLPKKINQ